MSSLTGYHGPDLIDYELAEFRAPWPLARSSRSPACKKDDHRRCPGFFEGDPRPGIHRGIQRCGCTCHGSKG